MLSPGQRARFPVSKCDATYLELVIHSVKFTGRNDDRRIIRHRHGRVAGHLIRQSYFNRLTVTSTTDI